MVVGLKVIVFVYIIAHQAVVGVFFQNVVADVAIFGQIVFGQVAVATGCA